MSVYLDMDWVYLGKEGPGISRQYLINGTRQLQTPLTYEALESAIWIGHDALYGLYRAFNHERWRGTDGG